MSIESKYQKFTQLQHAKQKSMWAGVNGMVDVDRYIFCGNPQTMEPLPDVPLFQKSIVTYNLVWEKCFDEPIVNVIDHHTRTKDSMTAITLVEVTFDKTTGRITIRNNGSGIEIVVHKEYQMHIPQFICSEFLAGTNLDKEEGCLTGGENGIGLKLTNAWSSQFTISTVDKERELLYVQTFNNNFTDIAFKINPPTITKSKAQGMTCIDYTPFYDHLGYEYKNNKLKPEDANLMEQIIITRLFYMSAFLGPASKSAKSIKNKVKITYNGTPIPIRDLSQFASAITTTPQTSFEITGTTGKLPWEIVIGLQEDGFETTSIINGVIAQKGTHINFLEKQILEILKPKVERLIAANGKYTKTMITNHMFIFFKGYIENTKWGGQRKDELTLPAKSFEGYTIKPTDLNAFWKLLQPLIEQVFVTKTIADDSKKRAVGFIKQYTKANKKSLKSSLIIPEGNSAESMIVSGLSAKLPGISYEYYGHFNIQGVPMNARKEVTEKSINGQKTYIRSKSLKENERLDSLVKVTGLDFNCTYDSTPAGDAEFNKLPYGRLILATDQDTDGIGNIRSMILNFIHLFWPNLIYKRQYIWYFDTVLIWGYPKRATEKVLPFYNYDEFNRFVKDKFNGDEDLAGKSYTFKYRKGLAGHLKPEILYMFKNFTQLLHVYKHDPAADALFNIYYGEKTDGRKKELCTPVDYTIPGLTPDGTSCAYQLRVFTKQYQLDNISRKLFHTIDGQLPTRRKLLAAARRKFANSNEEIKLFQLAGYTAENFNYHNGDASINSVLVTMAQENVSFRNLPLLRALGQFGTRKHAGGDAGSPRYIETKLNKRLANAIFPPQDDALLEWTIDDGKKGEPVYYVPVIPMVCLESMTIPATGWKCSIFARDFTTVIALVRKLIKLDFKEENSTESLLNGQFAIHPKVGQTVDQLGFIKEWVDNYSGKIEEHKGKRYMYGEYTLKGNVLSISELPFGIDPTDYVEKMSANDYVSNAICRSSDNYIDVEITLKPGAVEKIKAEYGTEELDPIQHFASMRKMIEQHLNLVDLKGNVHEFANYGDIIKYWYHIRRLYYTLRHDRNTEILRYQIIEMENIIRFVDEKSKNKLNLEKQSRSAAYDIIAKAKFVLINSKALHDNRQIKTSELKSSIFGASASYDYLLSMTQYDTLDDAIEGYKTKLASFQKELNDLVNKKEPFKGALAWLEELDEVERTVKLGKELGWGYGLENTNF